MTPPLVFAGYVFIIATLGLQVAVPGVELRRTIPEVVEIAIYITGIAITLVALGLFAVTHYRQQHPAS